MQIQLTIIIPAYNAENYLNKCLDSMVGIDSRLEVIVIDDGSVDHTGEIADRYAEKYLEQVRVIHKKNGGHGSGINTGTAVAKGHYFKIVDADDWILSENLSSVLDKLSNFEVDAVISGFHRVEMMTGRRIPVSSQCTEVGREVPFSEINEVYAQIPECFSFHGLFYHTQRYREHAIRLTENVFYEDQEYAAFPFSYVTSLLILPEFFYQYQVGNNEQSIFCQNQVARIGHMESVLHSMETFRKTCHLTEPEREMFLERRTAMVAVSCFATALVKNKNRARGKADYDRLYNWLTEEDPQLLHRIKNKIRLLYIYRTLHLPPELYEYMNRFASIKKLHKLWTK